jgi:flavin-dependent dehydrogenase
LSAIAGHHAPYAVVAGAGPAGAVAAILLARAAWRVALIEQRNPPLHKVCGECLSALGQDVLRRIGLLPSIMEPRPILLERTLLHSREPGSCSVVRLPRPMLGISRCTLDERLLNAARSAGARLLQPARCERVWSDDGAASARIRWLDSNAVETIDDADVVLIADGKAAVGAASRASLTGDLGIQAHFRGINGPRDAIELFSFDGHYGGLAPVEGGFWNLALSVPARRVAAHCGRLDDLLDVLCWENPNLASRLAGAARDSAWHASALPRFGVARGWPARTIPIGNAAAAIEPIGGEGMGLAVRSAEIAAAELIASHRAGRPINVKAIRSAYRGIWRVRAIASRAAALALSRDYSSRMIIEGASIPAFASAALRAIGKAR